jgi:DNA-binding MarR family transcriptional regulator
VTDWLNPVEARAWRAVVALLNRLPGALDTDLQRESGVTHFEYWVLTLLSEAPDRRLQMSELAQRANSSLSRLSHVVSKLERMGWATRTAATGRRGVLALLTDAGQQKVVETAPGYMDVVEGLDAEQTAALADLGETLTTHLGTVLGRSGQPASDSRR